MVAAPLFLLAVATTSVLASSHNLERRAHPIKAAVQSSAAVAGASSTITSAPAAGATPAPAAANPGGTPLPLTAYTYAYDQIPYQVNPFQYLRGPQSGYNICNSTTSGSDSQCQTLILNSISDFCLWGAPETTPTGSVGTNEAASVAYCVLDHGARLLPAGAVSAIQFMRTTHYIQISGFIDQTALNLMRNDTGGEYDPHGADLLGNPLGGLVYSNGLPSGDNKTLTQVVEWNNFLGGGTFCFKLCDPTMKPNYCENRYDLLGCAYNMPASYRPDEFSSCEGELQDIVGRYVGTDGKTSTFSQPDPLPADLVMPYTPRIPASSNCVLYQSSDLFKAATSTLSAPAGASTSHSLSMPGASNAAGAAGQTKPSSGAMPTSTSKTGAASTQRASFGLMALGLLGGAGLFLA